jgi:hypothetical protein
LSVDALQPTLTDVCVEPDTASEPGCDGAVVSEHAAADPVTDARVE